MRILQGIPTMAGGGSERQLSYLAAALNRRGVDIHVAVRKTGPNLDRLRASGATLHWLPEGNNHSPRIGWALHRLVADLRPDIVQTWLRQMDIIGGLVALLHRVPWVVSERNSALAYPPSPKHAVRAWLARRARAVISNSETGDAYWKDILPDARRHVIYNGLSLDEIEGTLPVDDETLRLAPGEKLMLFAGRFETQKNLDNLLLALGAVFDRVPAKMVLCGAGPERARLEQQVRSQPWADRVVFAGYASNLWAWMKRADLFISVSWHEGRPNTVIEAMACGCTLVVSNIPEHLEFLDDTCARLVPPGDVPAITNAIVLALTDDAASRGRVAVAKAKARQWSVDVMAENYVRAYEEILRRRHCGAAAPPAAATRPLDLSSKSAR